jgi:hypothetical protein
MVLDYQDTMSVDLAGVITGPRVCRVGFTPICGGSSPETISGCVT